MPERKRQFNLRLFREVAPRYNLITRLLSFGRDAAWKRELVDALPPTAQSALDLACGTGDLTRALARRYPGAQTVGLDLSPEMLDRARAATPSDAIRFVEGDLQALPFPEASFDVVTAGYALRNAPDLSGALAEIRRVLRPGGTLATLDFSRSPHPLVWRIHYSLLKGWGGFWGLALHGHADVYGYIAESLRTHPDRATLRTVMRAAGFSPLCVQPRMAGMIEWSLFERTP